MKALSSLLALALAGTAVVFAAAPPPSAPPLPPEYRDYRTVDTAIRTKIANITPDPKQAQPGYLGVTTETKDGKLTVAAVEADSPAARAGLAVGDVLLRAATQILPDGIALGDLVRGTGPGAKLPLMLQRDGQERVVTVVLGATSRPLSALRRVVVGADFAIVAEGLKVKSVASGLPAEKAQLKVGDVLTALDGESLVGKESLTPLADRRPGEQVKVSVLRGESKLDVVLTLIADPTEGPGGKGKGKGGKARSWDDTLPRGFRRPVYKLAIIGIEYPDVTHNEKVKPSDWENAMFSTKTYTNRSVTGQRVYGSMNDYWIEQSNGKFRVEGKAFDWVKVKRKRAEYASDSNKANLLIEAMDVLQARDGKQALEGYDGIYFMYAGRRYQTNRGGLYWPHRANFRHGGRSWPYFICPEGGETMDSISVITHEFGHLLGFPDLYARPEVPGQEGLGLWCTMAVGHGRDGKPLHISAWCKEQLGWINPTVIDPRVKQKLVLSPIENTFKECFKIPLRLDGSEYLLLENRRKIGFDRDLPGEGLLIWRVLDGRPILEESHGIGGSQGPNLYLQSIPYPTASNNAFTPFTTPSSKSLKGGGLPVFITNIKKLSDGRIAFHIGYEYY